MNGTALPQICGPERDIDVRRVARLLLDWYGSSAAARARLWAEDRRKSKAASEYAVWLQIELEIRRRTLHRPGSGGSLAVA